MEFDPGCIRARRYRRRLCFGLGRGVLCIRISSNGRMEIMMNTAVKRMMLNISAGLSLSAAVFAQGYQISTVAGSVKSNNGDGVLASSAPLLNPQQIAVDSSGNVYIADGDAHRVRLITASTGIMTTIAGQGRNVGS